jgi:hypothetical protein
VDKATAQLAYLACAWCNMKAIEIARQLNRDAAWSAGSARTMNKLENAKTEKKIAKLIAK